MRLLRTLLPLSLLAACAAPGDADYHHESIALEHVPACTSCAWAHEVCGEQARAQTLADLREERCGLLVCLVWHHQRIGACEESYSTCVVGCI